MKKNIKYNCKDCGVEVETRAIGDGVAYLAKQCPQCYSMGLIARSNPLVNIVDTKPKEAPEPWRRTVSLDPLNPRLQVEQIKCNKCGEWFHHEDIIWALPDGTLNTDTGLPWCMGCLPEEGDN